MALKSRVVPALVVAVLALAGGAQAGVLYENPGSGYSFNSTPIGYDPDSFNYAGNSFVLGSAAVVTGVNFASWHTTSDLIKSVSWAVLDDKVGLGTILAKGAASVSANFNQLNFYNAAIADNTFTIPDLTLGAGTYWLYLSEAVTFDGLPTSWDNTTLGTSLYHNGSGRTSGNTFRIYGEALIRDPGNGGGDGDPCHTNLPLACGGGSTGAVPEPASWALMIAGFGLAGATLRQRRGALRLQHI